MQVEGRFTYLPVSPADVRREIYVTSVGRLNYEPGQPYPCEGHPDDYAFQWRRGRELADFALVLVESGRGEFEDRALGRVGWNAGELLLLPPGVWHRYRPLRKEGWAESWMCANGDFLHRLRGKGLFPRSPVLRRLRDLNGYREAFERVRKEGGRRNSLRLAALALEAIARAVEDDEIGHRGHLPAATGDEIVDRAVEFIWLNSHRPLTAGTLATAIGCTRRTLERQFAGHHERTIADEIAWCRVQRARLLLAESRMSLKEIGYAAGFGGTRRLRRAFLRCGAKYPRPDCESR